MRPLPEDSQFWDSFLPFQRQVAWAGMQSSLAQVVLKVASPGMPDFYQGSELWDLRLVDPDNRGPVNFRELERLLDAMVSRTISQDGLLKLARELAGAPEDGRIKLFAIWRCLALRRKYPELFATGEYLSLEVTGGQSAHVVALARTKAKSAVLAVTGRLFHRLRVQTETGMNKLAVGRESWGKTHLKLPPQLATGRFRDQLTGNTLAPDMSFRPADGPTLALADVFSVLPVAMLEWNG